MQSKQTNDTSAERTHFGFETVSGVEKRSRVMGVFSSVAGKYDLMNDLMSGGMHRLWKRRMFDVAAVRPGARVLDVAAGSGDIAIGFLRGIQSIIQKLQYSFININFILCRVQTHQAL